MVWRDTLHLRGFMHYITAHYQFIPIENIELTKQKLTEIAQETGTLGLIILAKEGINSTVSNKSAEGLQLYKEKLLQYFNLEKMNAKDSESEVRPFRKLSVKIREEIVTTGRNDLTIGKDKNHHLSPDEWNQVIEKENPVNSN